MNDTACCDFDDIVKAMADKNRQYILSLLHQGELNEADIVSHFHLTQPTISHYLALLRGANLVSVRREGRYTYYRANTTSVTECCKEILTRFTLPDRKV